MFSSNYLVYRHDRALQQLALSKGGGALLAINSKFHCSETNVSSVTTVLPMVDFLGVKISLDHSMDLFIFVVYIPPRISYAEFELFFDLLNKITQIHSDHVILLGDFNTPSFATNENNNFSTILNNFQSFHNFSQHNSCLNEYGGTLDLVFSNVNCSVFKSDSPLVHEDKYHPSLEILVVTATSSFSNFQMNSQPESFNFKKANFPLMYEMLTNVDWSFLNNIHDVNDACKQFYERLRIVFEATVPKLRVKQSSRFSYPPWFDFEIINCIRLKSSAHKEFKKSKNVYYKNLFIYYRSKSKTLIEAAYKRYIFNIQNSINCDPKKFWSFIHTKRKNTRIPGLMKFDNEELTSPEAIVNGFAEFFKSVYTTSDPNVNIEQKIYTNDSLSVLHFTEDEIQKTLKNSKNSLTTGADGIPSFLLRDCAIVLSTPLHHIFNLILRKSIFPDVWKIAHVTPIFKKDEINDVRNYRPISILSNLAKAFETLLYNRIYNGVKNTISMEQHGFMTKRSTVTNLACVSQYISQAIDCKSQVDVIYTDVQKAFDQIDHFILLKKLEWYGLSSPLMSLIKSYLDDRVQYVKYRNFISEKYAATSGVPQGSNLGPLLFLLYINDIVTVIKCLKLLFADDLKLYQEISWLENCEALQADLRAVEEWCISNRLSLNISKCCVVSYTRKQNAVIYPYSINNVVLSRNLTIKDLGVTFDSKLTFCDHILDVISKAYKMFGFLYRNCREFTSVHTICLLYCSLIRSRLEYAALIWFPIHDIFIKQLESVQRKFLKFLSYLVDGDYVPRSYDHGLLLNRFNFNSLLTRRIFLSVKFLYNLLNNKIDCNALLNEINFNVPRQCTRTHICFYLRPNRTYVGAKSPLSVMCEKFNSIANTSDIHFDTIVKIKESVVCHYGV